MSSISTSDSSAEEHEWKIINYNTYIYLPEGVDLSGLKYLVMQTADGGPGGDPEGGFGGGSGSGGG